MSMVLASLYPDRITLRTEKKESMEVTWANKMYAKATKVDKPKNQVAISSLANLKRKKNSWKLSPQSKRKLQDSFQLLDQLATPRTVYPNAKKPIYNFRTSFITLTLPSPQMHSDTEIKAVCLNQFLTIMRQRFGLRNYVWKAELQKNENIHFHICWDLYIHHKAVRYYWNQALELLGYVSSYQEKYCNMSLRQYAESRGIEVQKAIKGFRYGRDSNWSSPPTEQVVAVRSSKQLAIYLRKYITKPVDSENGEKSGNEAETDELTYNRITNFGRVWARSQSLSKIKFITRYDWQNLSAYLKTLGSYTANFHTVVYDYVTVLYFNFSSCTSKFRSWLSRKIKELGYTYNYMPSG